MNAIKRKQLLNKKKSSCNEHQVGFSKLRYIYVRISKICQAYWIYSPNVQNLVLFNTILKYIYFNLLFSSIFCYGNLTYFLLLFWYRGVHDPGYTLLPVFDQPNEGSVKNAPGYISPSFNVLFETALKKRIYSWGSFVWEKALHMTDH